LIIIIYYHVISVGGLPASGYWDPLNLAAGKDDKTLAYYRAAELKHGRVAMVASLGVIFQGLNTGMYCYYALKNILLIILYR
jgi:hypothetical protein